MSAYVTEMHILPGMLPSDFGQAVSVPGHAPGLTQYALVSYITTPITAETRQDYVVLVLGTATTAGNIWPVIPSAYRWKVASRPNGWTIVEVTTTQGVWYWKAAAAGDIRVSVDVMDGTTVLGTLALDQTIQPMRQDVVDHVATYGLSRIDVLHELMVDFYPYISEAVLATGANGVPAAMVAACLYHEMLSRFREGSPEAEVYRGKVREGIEGGDILGFWDYIFELEGKKAASVHFGREDDRVREVELDLIRELYEEEIVYRWSGGKSLGVGQLRQSTAAMVRSQIPWREWTRDPNDQRAIAEQIDNDWSALDKPRKAAIYNLLRFPKTCIRLVAEFLALIKNRPFTRTGDASTTTRWPTLTRAQLLANEGAASVIGQEFNVGASTTPAGQAKANNYGRYVWKYMHQESSLDPDHFFPEPP